MGSLNSSGSFAGCFAATSSAIWNGLVRLFGSDLPSLFNDLAIHGCGGSPGIIAGDAPGTTVRAAPGTYARVAGNMEFFSVFSRIKRALKREVTNMEGHNGRWSYLLFVLKNVRTFVIL